MHVSHRSYENTRTPEGESAPQDELQREKEEGVMGGGLAHGFLLLPSGWPLLSTQLLSSVVII